jgi:hypothetical protein
MSIGEFPKICGDVLLIPRIQPDTTRSKPEYDGMGILVGPGVIPGSISAVVTGKQGVRNRILDGNYQPTTPGLLNFRLEGSSLVAYDRDSGSDSDFTATWPLPEGYVLPFQTRDGTELKQVEHIEIEEFEPLFKAELRSYEDDMYVSKHGIALYGMKLLSRSREKNRGQIPRGVLEPYNDGQVLLGAAKPGQLVVALVGRLGARSHILSRNGREIGHGSHGFRVAGGNIYGQTGATEKRVARMTSRRLHTVAL